MNSILKGLTQPHSSLAYKTDVNLTSIHSDFKNTILFYNILFYLL